MTRGRTQLTVVGTNSEGITGPIKARRLRKELFPCRTTAERADKAATMTWLIRENKKIKTRFMDQYILVPEDDNLMRTAQPN